MILLCVESSGQYRKSDSKKNHIRLSYDRIEGQRSTSFISANIYIEQCEVRVLRMRIRKFSSYYKKSLTQKNVMHGLFVRHPSKIGKLKLFFCVYICLKFELNGPPLAYEQFSVQIEIKDMTSNIKWVDKATTVSKLEWIRPGVSGCAERIRELERKCGSNKCWNFIYTCVCNGDELLFDNISHAAWLSPLQCPDNVEKISCFRFLLCLDRSALVAEAAEHIWSWRNFSEILFDRVRSPDPSIKKSKTGRGKSFFDIAYWITDPTSFDPQSCIRSKTHDCGYWTIVECNEFPRKDMSKNPSFSKSNWLYKQYS